MTVDFGVLYRRTAAYPPIEKGDIKTPSEPHEKKRGEKPEHERFEFERHPIGNTIRALKRAVLESTCLDRYS
jgi:hypothetical protein